MCVFSGCLVVQMGGLCADDVREGLHLSLLCRRNRLGNGRFLCHLDSSRRRYPLLLHLMSSKQSTLHSLMPFPAYSYVPCRCCPPNAYLKFLAVHVLLLSPSHPRTGMIFRFSLPAAMHQKWRTSFMAMSPIWTFLWNSACQLAVFLPSKLSAVLFFLETELAGYSQSKMGTEWLKRETQTW